jgi:hypothetical protein
MVITVSQNMAMALKRLRFSLHCTGTGITIGSAAMPSAALANMRHCNIVVKTCASEWSVASQYSLSANFAGRSQNESSRQIVDRTQGSASQVSRRGQ